MTTPKELAEEFRRLAEIEQVDRNEDSYVAGEMAGIKETWAEAAEMVEAAQAAVAQALADELRNLAAEAKARSESPNNAFWQAEEAESQAFNRAAQMVEERLNADSV